MSRNPSIETFVNRKNRPVCAESFKKPSVPHRVISSLYFALFMISFCVIRKYSSPEMLLITERQWMLSCSISAITCQKWRNQHLSWRISIELCFLYDLYAYESDPCTAPLFIWMILLPLPDRCLWNLLCQAAVNGHHGDTNKWIITSRTISTSTIVWAA